VYNALHIDAHFELNKVFDGLSADPELMGRDRHRRRRQRRSAPATI
jgi:hypothetical protein